MPGLDVSTRTVEHVSTLGALQVLSRANAGIDARPATVPVKDLRTLFVYLCNGSVEAIAFCKRIELTDSELILRLGNGEVKRFRRRDVYLASWGQVAPPVMF